MSENKAALIILDGWGQGKKCAANAVCNAVTPNIDAILAKYPHTLINASGEAVGLPAGQMGNSEVGHLNMGAGRVVYQDLTRISKDIRDGGFFKNSELLQAMLYAQQNNKAFHIMGLLSDGGVHSHNTHLYALLKMAQMNGLREVYVHAFLDGRDTPPQSGLDFIQALQTEMGTIGIGKIATVSGRYYAMDRDNRYERVQKAYDAMVQVPEQTAADAAAYVAESYRQGVYDEFVLPCAMSGTQRIDVGDAVVFINFRPDRAREITRALVDEQFEHFERPKALKLYYVCMTEYDATIQAHIAYPQHELKNTLGEVLAQAGKTQLRIAETEKYAHVTFFFNGGVEAPNAGETRVLIPSPKVATYDLKPQMSAYEVKDKLLEILHTQNFDAIILNFANADMVGHTGIYSAGIQAMQAVDQCVGAIVPPLLAQGYEILLTADHGNLELMEDETTHLPFTAHTPNPVELVLIGTKHLDAKLRSGGALCDVAPTLLELMDLEQPSEMSGQSLISK